MQSARHIPKKYLGDPTGRAIWFLDHRMKESALNKHKLQRIRNATASKAVIWKFLENKLWHTAKKRAERAVRPLEFNLTRAWIRNKLQKGVCEVTGIPFDYSTSGRGGNPFCPSIDRKDNSKGYTEANCQMVVWIHNCARNGWGNGPLARYIVAMVRKYPKLKKA